MREITISEAVDKLSEALKSDNEFRHTYQAYIAVCMYDAIRENSDSDFELLDKCNIGAHNFLNLLTQDTKEYQRHPIGTDSKIGNVSCGCAVPKEALLRHDLTKIFSKYEIGNDCGTPDHTLAIAVIKSLENINWLLREREEHSETLHKPRCILTEYKKSNIGNIYDKEAKDENS